MTRSGVCNSPSIEESECPSNLIILDEGNIKQCFPCQHCKDFWIQINGNTDSLHSKHIKDQFEASFPYLQNHKIIWEKIWNTILNFLNGYPNSLDVGSEEIIVVSQFLCLLRHFGCIKRRGDSCFLISNIEYLMEHAGVLNKGKMESWFAGHKSKDDASRLLGGEDKGTFLVRFSETYMEEGGFAVSVVERKNEEVRHYIIKTSSTCCHENHYDGQFQLLVNNETDEDDHPDLVTFVDQRLRADYVEGLECNYICPDLKYNADFTGYRNALQIGK